MKTPVLFLTNLDHDLRTYHDFKRGWEVILFDYSRYLVEKGFEPIWVALTRKGTEVSTIFENIPVIRIERIFGPLGLLDFLVFFLKMLHELRKERIRLVYTRVSSLAFVAGFVCKLTQSQLIFHVEDLEADLAMASSEKGSLLRHPDVPILRYAQRSAASMAKQIITVSKAFKSYLVENWHIPEEKVCVIYEGVEKKPQPRRSSPHDLPFSIAYVGGVSPYDGIDTLLNAFKIVLEERESTRLVVATFAPESGIAPFRKMCESLGLADKVVFHTSITSEMARGLVRDADIGVIPRKKVLSTRLTTSSVIFLYFSEGTAVVVPRLEAMMELIPREDLFFEPENPLSLANTLAKIISHKELHNELQDYVRELATEFDREKMCEALANLMRAAVQ